MSSFYFDLAVNMVQLGCLKFDPIDRLSSMAFLTLLRVEEIFEEITWKKCKERPGTLMERKKILVMMREESKRKLHELKRREWLVYARREYERHIARLEEQLERVEYERERIERLMEVIYRTLSWIGKLFEQLMKALLFICNFSEFPNKFRPPCTTMPWNIWPALVVLWGVCWMFYDNCGPVHHFRQQPLSAEEEQLQQSLRMSPLASTVAEM